MLLTSYFQKTDALNAQMLSGATSGTLLSGNFGSPSGRQILVIDRAVAGKAEVIAANVAGTGLTNMTRGLSGTSAVQHEVGATVEFVFEPALFAALASFDGWTRSYDVFTRTSGTTMTVPVDMTGVTSIGDRVKVTDSSTKYFYVVNQVFSAGVTTYTLTAGTDFTLAASPTEVWFSKAVSPNGFPLWFNYTPTYSASGSMTYTAVTTNRARFKINSREVLVDIRTDGTTGGTASFGLRFTLPVTAVGSYDSPAVTNDAGGNLAGSIQDVSTTVAECRRFDSSNYGLGASRTIKGNLIYGI
jgi:hypothetical protein